MESEEIIAGSIILAIVAKIFYDKSYSDLIQLKHNIIVFVTASSSWYILFSIYTFIVISFVFVNYKLGSALYMKIKQNKEEDVYRESRISKYKDKLHSLQEDIESGQQEIRSVNFEIEEIEKRYQEKLRAEEREQKKVLSELNIFENTVFKKSQLTEIEIKALLENNFEQTNEFSVFEKKQITVLVKKVLNHSLTHTFLVWDIIRLLETIEGIYNIQVHLSVNSDITFTFHNFAFSIEVETGTLLGKTKQIEDKKKYLDRKYPGRSIVVVSHKDLVWQYRKLGFFSTQRNDVEENLKKMLKSATQLKRVE